ncbi:MAG: hypothetical protein U1E89_13110 [Burkholderiaceae bacterium]
MLAPLRLCDGAALAFDIPQAEAHAHGALRRIGWLNLALGCFVDRTRLVEGSVGRWVQFRNHHVNGDAYGGLIGNAVGFARYLQALWVGDILLPAARDSLFDAVPAPGPPRSLGWFMGRLGEEPWFAHAGGGAGYYCEIRVYPRTRNASVVMLNRAGIRDEHLLDRLDHFFVTRRHRT